MEKLQRGVYIVASHHHPERVRVELAQVSDWEDPVCLCFFATTDPEAMRSLLEATWAPYRSPDLPDCFHIHPRHQTRLLKTFLYTHRAHIRITYGRLPDPSRAGSIGAGTRFTLTHGLYILATDLDASFSTFKLGHSQKVTTRLGTHKTSLVGMRLVLFVLETAPDVTEKHLHRELRERVRNEQENREWFHMSLGELLTSLFSLWKGVWDPSLPSSLSFKRSIDY